MHENKCILCGRSARVAPSQNNMMYKTWFNCENHCGKYEIYDSEMSAIASFEKKEVIALELAKTKGKRSPVTFDLNYMYMVDFIFNNGR